MVAPLKAVPEPLISPTAPADGRPPAGGGGDGGEPPNPDSSGEKTSRPHQAGITSAAPARVKRTMTIAAEVADAWDSVVLLLHAAWGIPKGIGAELLIVHGLHPDRIEAAAVQAGYGVRYDLPWPSDLPGGVEWTGAGRRGEISV